MIPLKHGGMYVTKGAKMKAKRYRLKKDLPGWEIGTIMYALNKTYSKTGEQMYGIKYTCVQFPEGYLESNPDWFEEIPEQQTAEEIISNAICQYAHYVGNNRSITETITEELTNAGFQIVNAEIFRKKLIMFAQEVVNKGRPGCQWVNDCIDRLFPDIKTVPSEPHTEVTREMLEDSQPEYEHAEDRRQRLDSEFLSSETTDSEFREAVLGKQPTEDEKVEELAKEFYCFSKGENAKWDDASPGERRINRDKARWFLSKFQKNEELRKVIECVEDTLLSSEEVEDLRHIIERFLPTLYKE